MCNLNEFKKLESMKTYQIPYKRITIKIMQLGVWYWSIMHKQLFQLLFERKFQIIFIYKCKYC